MFEIKNLQHQYQQLKVLDITDWQAQQGEQWLVLGGSGSGKTTLLHILAGLRTPTQGLVKVANVNLNTLNGARLDRFRGQNIGLVFQKPHLAQTLTVMQNLLLAQYMAGLRQNHSHCEAVLKSLSVLDKKNTFPAQLSQGQAQRVSVARAVLNQPKLLLADEPTASLDDKNAAQVLDLLMEQAQNYQATLLIATHDQRVKEKIALSFELNNAL
ncbi:MAG: ATP-binding cassette domain-containing protein [Microscillaceae bacterium]|jgi:putative ABC transport system ATP-binding protein|nr:ATP-binding cassette domain-containing protein [Microscillaceae bacterium]